MHRRGTVRFGTLLVAIVVAVFALLGASGSGVVTATASAPPATSASGDVSTDEVPPAPSDTVSDFYPDEANLSDCVGLVEKPGCGSDSRGGWHQMLVFVALFIGLGVILWRVSLGISANRARIDAGGEQRPSEPVEAPGSESDSTLS